ncbi:aldo/keto reductase [Granulosicoccus antarcticus]|uniref:Pyridoxal 4-dehydrogenase n=1 Tax=Granulosicoccus antarcticus IMCC3135 TaxID=1192854 RepID=A0A2Z2NLW7_9GAMM|nr:aldo/keto reductase [Granulosicoccus antarcticus]ASJ70768.1 Pyridoxal 4-dehydrogenase [Granulosicoccus antarcticus IMCC3135]
MNSIKMRQLGNSQVRVSELGLGCASLAGVGSSVSDSDARATLNAALDAGISYFDTAPFYGYGRSERLVGDALRKAEAPIQLSSKVGRLLKPCAEPQVADSGWPDALPMQPHYDYSYDGVMRSVEDSLQRLGLASMDIALIHDIDIYTHGKDIQKSMMATAMSGGYKALAELRSAGVIKAVGLGVNENQVCIEALQQGDWDCFLLAGRYTLLEQSALDELFPACEKAGTSIIIGGPFNSGILVGGSTYNYDAAPADVMQRVSCIQQVCAAHNVELAAAALQFTLRSSLVSSVIPGPRSAAEFASLLAWYEASIPDSLWSDLQSEGLLRADAPTRLEP